MAVPPPPKSSLNGEGEQYSEGMKRTQLLLATMPPFRGAIEGSRAPHIPGPAVIASRTVHEVVMRWGDAVGGGGAAFGSLVLGTT